MIQEELSMNRLYEHWLSGALVAALPFFSAGTILAQYTVSKLATSGPTVTLNGNGVAADAAGNVYGTGQYPSTGKLAVFEVLAGASAAPQIIPAAGAPSGGGPGCSPWSGTATSVLLSPIQLSSDYSGNIYISDEDAPAALRLQAGILTTLPGNTTCNNNAQGVAADIAGNSYFSTGDGGPFVYKISASGAETSIAGNGTLGCANGSIGRPQGIAVDANGNVYIADEYCNVIWKVPPSEAPVVFAGVKGLQNAGCSDQEGVSATSLNLDGPYGVAVDIEGNVFIADTGCGRIRMLDNGVNHTIATGLSQPRGIAVGPGGDIYVGEWGATDILQLKPAAAQMISPLPGSVLPGTTETFDWSGGPAGSQYKLDVNDKMPLPPIGQGDIFGNGNGTTGKSELVSDIPCDGRTIYVRLSSLTNGQSQTGLYTYTADTCKMLHLSASPTVMPQQGGTLTLSAQVENFTTATESVRLSMTGNLVVCLPGSGLCKTTNVVIGTTSLTLIPEVPQTVTHSWAVPALPSADHASVEFKAYITTLGGAVLDSASVTVIQN